MNIIVLKGRFTADPTLTPTNSGTHVTDFTLAVDRPFSKNNETDFIDCVAWRTTADFITKHFAKGKPILINGSLTTGIWEDRDGKKRKSVKVLVDNAEFAGGDKVSAPTEVIPVDTPDVFAQTALTDLGPATDDELPF